MATTVQATIKSSCQLLHNNTVDGNTYSGTPSRSVNATLSTAQVSKAYYGTLSITTSTTTLVLNDNSLSDAYGNALTFTSVREVFITHTDATNTLTVGGGSNAVFSALPAVKSLASGVPAHIHLLNPFTVDATHCNLALTASAGTISVEIMVVGN